MEVSTCWKIVEFQKLSIKMKNCKTFYEARTASCLKKIIQFPQKPQTTPNQIKSYYIFGIKIFLQRYTEIYRHLLPKCFKNTVFGRQEMVQRKCLFWHKQKHVCWKMCQVRKVFDCVAGVYIIFDVKWVEIRKINEVFLVKLYCKMSDIFR